MTAHARIVNDNLLAHLHQLEAGDQFMIQELGRSPYYVVDLVVEVLANEGEAPATVQAQAAALWRPQPPGFPWKAVALPRGQ